MLQDNVNPRRKRRGGEKRTSCFSMKYSRISWKIVWKWEGNVSPSPSTPFYSKPFDRYRTQRRRERFSSNSELPEAEFMNIQFLSGFWFSREFSDLMFLYGFLKPEWRGYGFISVFPPFSFTGYRTRTVTHCRNCKRFCELEEMEWGMVQWTKRLAAVRWPWVRISGPEPPKWGHPRWMNSPQEAPPKFVDE